jgi:hypothetical protein
MEIKEFNLVFVIDAYDEDMLERIQEISMYAKTLN